MHQTKVSLVMKKNNNNNNSNNNIKKKYNPIKIETIQNLRINY